MDPFERAVHHGVIHGIKELGRFIKALVKEKQKESAIDAKGAEPILDQCPEGYPIKANESGIYHVPGGHFYTETTPVRCFANATDAEAAGYRKSQRG